MTAHAVQRSVAENTLLSQFEADSALSRSPSRAAAFNRFAEQGLPTRRVESWHYTDLRAAMRDAAPLVAAPDFATIELSAPANSLQVTERREGRLVLLNGRPIPQLCDQFAGGGLDRSGKAVAPAQRTHWWRSTRR